MCSNFKDVKSWAKFSSGMFIPCIVNNTNSTFATNIGRVGSSVKTTVSAAATINSPSNRICRGSIFAVLCWCVRYRSFEFVVSVCLLLEEVVYVHCPGSFLLKVVFLQQINCLLPHVQVFGHWLKSQQQPIRNCLLNINWLYLSNQGLLSVAADQKNYYSSIWNILFMGPRFGYSLTLQHRLWNIQPRLVADWVKR